MASPKETLAASCRHPTVTSGSEQPSVSIDLTASRQSVAAAARSAATLERHRRIAYRTRHSHSARSRWWLVGRDSRWGRRALAPGADRCVCGIGRTVSGKQGLSAVPGGAVLAAKDGCICFGSAGALNRLYRGQVTLYRQRSAPLAAGAREMVIREMPNPSLASLFQDSRGRIWLSSQTAIGYLKNDRFTSTAAPGGIVAALDEDSAGKMWAA
jgi:hypothetical protein